MQIIAFLFLKVYMDDINAQPKIFTRNFYEIYIKDKAPHDFSLDLFLLYTAKKNNYSIKTIPVFFKKDFMVKQKVAAALKPELNSLKEHLIILGN